jgi:glycogen operon protein
LSNELFELLPGKNGAPQGASLDEEGCNFVVCSPEATEVFLCLFDQNEHEINRFRIIERNGPYWCCYVKGVRAGQFMRFVPTEATILLPAILLM